MIAIIAILAALLFPVFAKTKAAAAITSCESNAKQIGSAIVMYADANGGRVPKYDDSDLGGSGPIRWDSPSNMWNSGLARLSRAATWICGGTSTTFSEVRRFRGAYPDCPRLLHF